MPVKFAKQSPKPYAFNGMLNLFKDKASLFLCCDGGLMTESRSSKTRSNIGFAVLVTRSPEGVARLFINRDEIAATNFQLRDESIIFHQAPYFGYLDFTADGQQAFGSIEWNDGKYHAISGLRAPLACVKTISKDNQVTYDFSLAYVPSVPATPSSKLSEKVSNEFTMHAFRPQGQQQQQAPRAQPTATNYGVPISPRGQATTTYSQLSPRTYTPNYGSSAVSPRSSSTPVNFGLPITAQNQPAHTPAGKPSAKTVATSTTAAKVDTTAAKVDTTAAKVDTTAAKTATSTTAAKTDSNSKQGGTSPSNNSMAGTTTGSTGSTTTRSTEDQAPKTNAIGGMAGATTTSSNAQHTDPTASGFTDHNLRLSDLMSLDPFRLDKNGNYVDFIQQRTMNDFYSLIMWYAWKYEKDMYKLVIGNDSEPDTSKVDYWLNHKVPGQDDFFKSLILPYMCTVVGTNEEMKNDSEKAKHVNYLRAQNFLKNATATDPAYQALLPLMYARTFCSYFSVMVNFLNDQNDNSKLSDHNQQIDTDAANWRNSVNTTYPADGDQSAKTALLDSIDQAVTTGKNKCYWAYMFFRHITAPQFILYLVGKVKAADNSSQEVDFAIKRFTAVLNILDPSNAFSGLWMKAIQGSILLTMLVDVADYGSNSNLVLENIDEILNQMAQVYANSSDAEMRAASQKITENMNKSDELSGINLYTKSLLLACANVEVITGFDALESAIRQNYNNLLNHLDAATVSRASGFVDIAILATGIISLALFAADGQIWETLTSTDKAAVILGLASWGAVMLKYVIQLGTTVWDALSTTIGYLRGAIQLLRFNNGTVMTATMRLIRDFVNRTNGILYMTSPQANGPALLADQAGEMGILQRILGRNFAAFTTRIAGVISLIGIVTGALALAGSQTPMDYVINSLFLAASALELVATVGGWVVEGATGLAVAGGLVAGVLSAVAMISTFASFLAILAVAAGIILMLVAWFLPVDNPIDDFVDEYVKGTVYYMKYTSDIDFIRTLPDNKGRYLYSGVTIKLSDNDSSYLKCTVDSTYHTVSCGTGTNNNTWETVLQLEVDYMGYMNIHTVVPMGNGRYLMKYLTIDENGNVSWQDPDISPSGDRRSDKQIWLSNLNSIGEMLDTKKVTDEAEVLTYCVTSIESNWFKKHGSHKFLAFNGNLTTDNNPHNIAVKLSGGAPMGYIFPNIVMYVGYEGQIYNSTLALGGSESNKVFHCTSSMPSFFTFDSTTGTLTQNRKLTNADVTDAYVVHKIWVTNTFATDDSVWANFWVQVKPQPTST